MVYGYIRTKNSNKNKLLYNTESDVIVEQEQLSESMTSKSERSTKSAPSFFDPPLEVYVKFNNSSKY